MRAIVIHAPHDLRIEAIDAGAPGPGEVRVRIETGGICGSDLHYYQHGGFGAVRIRQPMVLGHEVAGVVEALGAGVTGLCTGERVAVSPSRPCGRCRYCQEGAQNHCLDMRFYGSAMRMPHVHGAFRQVLVADAAQCHPVGELSAGEAAMAEPLAVTLHAARRAGQLLGKRVLVTGAGPIGALCVLAARRAGAVEIVATDIADKPLGVVADMGADRTINVATSPDALAVFGKDKGSFDVLLEATGNERALIGALDVVRPRGTIVQVGLGAGPFNLPINTVVAKEIELRGTFRFHEEFATAVALMRQGLVDVKPLITATLPFEQAVDAFKLASDRSTSMKVQLAFG
jgi:L-idonate 5-dehydrogenase